jgi:hypothetical protein
MVVVGWCCERGGVWYRGFDNWFGGDAAVAYSSTKGEAFHFDTLYIALLKSNNRQKRCFDLVLQAK